MIAWLVLLQTSLTIAVAGPAQGPIKQEELSQVYTDFFFRGLLGTT